MIAPHAVDGRLLADGGILDPLRGPIAAVNADLTIAVSLSGSEVGEVSENRGAEPGVTVEWLNRMVRSTSALFDTAAARSLLDRPTPGAALSRFGGPAAESDAWSDDADAEQPAADRVDPDDTAEEPGVPKLGSFEVMYWTIDIARSALARHALAAYPPDLLIEAPRSTCRSLEFHRAAEVIAAGRALADQVLDTLDIEADMATPPAIEG